MKLKYILLTLSISFMLIVSFTGCSNQPSAATPNQTSTLSPASAANVPANSPLSGKEISVFAGSASKPALDEAAAVFEKQTGVKVFLTYGGSGTVLSQMELSKSGDLYIPGSPDYLVKSESKKITDPATTRIVAYLIPAINVQTGNPQNIQSLSDLAKPGIKVGIGNPTTVCVGLYAVEILDRNSLLADVYKNIVTQAASCDNTATLISLKSVDAVMGWSVFQAWDPKSIQTVYLKPEQISRIAYIPAAISTFVKEKEAASAFIDFLVSADGQNIFKKWGYDVTESEARKYAPNAQIGGEYQIPDSWKALTK
ncbi:MAG: molybdate ABC transporter substrate-binding protein [Dehalococcoidales bacterium]|nr:molybdate ABC transporter substrate-binding protein [Dehalococcoidales bacterium]